MKPVRQGNFCSACSGGGKDAPMLPASPRCPHRAKRRTARHDHKWVIRTDNVRDFWFKFCTVCHEVEWI